MEEWAGLMMVNQIIKENGGKGNLTKIVKYTVIENATFNDYDGEGPMFGKRWRLGEM